MNRCARWISRRASCVLAGASLLFLIATGCGRRVALVPVAGRVTLDGNAIVNASILVQPGAGPAARGVTDGDGRFALSTYGEQDGAIPGPAVVSISRYERVAQAAADEGEPPLGKNLLPARYADPATSGLRAVIEPGMAPLKFPLSSE